MNANTQGALPRRALARLRFHRLSLAILACFIAVGQSATLMQRPLAADGQYTHSYYAAALLILQSPSGLVQSLRTPGFPLFWALIMRLAGINNESVVVYAQAAVAVVMLVECYVLLYRITYRRWIACTVASLLALNLYVLGWERVLDPGLLTMWSVVTLFLVFERLVRLSTIRHALLFALVSFMAVMVSPTTLYLPLVLLALIVARALWMRGWGGLRQVSAPVLASGGLMGVLLLTYCVANQAINGYFGLSWDSNVALLGKIWEYHMENAATPQQYAQLQANVTEYLRSNPPHPADPYPQVPADPWAYLNTHQSDYFGEGMSYQGGFRPVGGYVTYIVEHHLATYVGDSLPYLYVAWSSTPQLYAPYSTGPDGHWVSDHSAIPGLTGYPIFGQGTASDEYEPGWVNMLLGISTILEESYALLPMFLVLLGYLLLARPRRTYEFLLLAILVCVCGGIAAAAFGNYAEFYRARSPVDWALMAVVLTVLLDYAARFLALARPAGEPVASVAEVRAIPSPALTPEAIPTWRSSMRALAETTLMAAVPDDDLPPWRRWAAAWLRRQRSPDANSPKR